MSDPNCTENYNVLRLQENIGRLEKKIADLEDEFEVSKKSGRSEAYIIVLKNEIVAKSNEIVATKNEIVATKNEMVELRKKENILLEKQKVSGIKSFPFLIF
jgi:hypothetical protein